MIVCNCEITVSKYTHTGFIDVGWPQVTTYNLLVGELLLGLSTVTLEYGNIIYMVSGMRHHIL